MFTTIQWWAKHNLHSITSYLEADYNGPKVFNMNAPVDCGKTFLINAILAYARGQRNKCISAASSESFFLLNKFFELKNWARCYWNKKFIFTFAFTFVFSFVFSFNFSFNFSVVFFAKRFNFGFYQKRELEKKCYRGKS